MVSRITVAEKAAEAARDAIRDELDAFDGTYSEHELDRLADTFEPGVRETLEYGLARLHSEKHDTELVTDGGNIVEPRSRWEARARRTERAGYNPAQTHLREFDVDDIDLYPEEEDA